MRKLVRAALAASVLLVGACGFHPLYAPATRAAIGGVDIGEIPGKTGHVLRTELMRRFDATRDSGPTHRLEIELSEQIVAIGLRVDESSTRSDIRLTANYRLLGEDGKPSLTGAVTGVASYDIPAGSYGELANQNDARERAAEVLADRLHLQIASRLASEARRAGASK